MKEELKENEQSLESVSEQITAATKELSELLDEFADYPSRMKTAVDNTDDEAMFNLQQRQKRLPNKIAVCEIKLARLELKRDELRMPGLQAKHQQISAVTQEANEKRLEAIKQYEILQGQVWSAHQDIKDLNIRIGERKRKLDQLVREANPAPQKTDRMLPYVGSR